MSVLDVVRVAARVRDTEAEGPGRRWALWVQGCPLRCAGCCNPEMLPERAPGQDELVAVDALAREAIEAPGIEGVSFLGGEPFAQAVPLAALAERVRAAGLSVMVFTGFTRAELEQRPDHDGGCAPKPPLMAGASALLAATDLLVDGRYDRTQPDTLRRWIGSQNQVLHFLTDRYHPDDPRFRRSNSVELRLRAGVLTVNGWPSAASQALRRRTG
jgi:anaerobic ribonucleoside-triphosphate reductase activating protein